MLTVEVVISFNIKVGRFEALQVPFRVDIIQGAIHIIYIWYSYALLLSKVVVIFYFRNHLFFIFNTMLIFLTSVDDLLKFWNYVVGLRKVIRSFLLLFYSKLLSNRNRRKVEARNLTTKIKRRRLQSVSSTRKRPASSNMLKQSSF